MNLTLSYVLAFGLVSGLAWCEPVRLLSPRQLTSGKEHTLRVQVPDALSPRLTWQIDVLHAPLAKGTLRLDPKGNGAIRLKAPVVEAGRDLTLRLRVFDSERTDLLLDTRLWVFPDTLLSQAAPLLRDVPFRILDPNGHLAGWLEKADLPFERVQEGTDLQEGWLLVAPHPGSSTDPDLMVYLLRQAHAGVPVLWLNPPQGVLPLPQPDKNTPGFDLTFAGPDFLTRLDKRLAASGIPGHRFRLVPSEKDVGIKVQEKHGWAWTSLRFQGGGALYLCGLDLQFRDVEPATRDLTLTALLTFLNTNHPPRGDSHE